MIHIMAGNTLGKIFLGISWLLLLGALTWYFNGLLAQRHNPNAEPLSQNNGSFRQVTLARNRNHHYLAGGFINQQPVTFLVDTGATQVALGPAVAKRLGLEPGRQGLARTANGTSTTYATTLASLRIGDIELYQVPASITMGMQGEQVLLGMSALKELELSHRQGILTLRQYPP